MRRADRIARASFTTRHRHYIRNLLRQLARLDRHTEFVVLCRPADCAAVIALGENFVPLPRLPPTIPLDASR